MVLIDTIRSAFASADDHPVSNEKCTMQQMHTATKTQSDRSRKTGRPALAKPAAVVRKKPSALIPGKTDIVLKKLHLARGVSIAQLVEATGWQAHSVRGFLSAVIRRKLGLALTSQTGKDGVRRYRIEDEAADKSGGAR